LPVRDLYPGLVPNPGSAFQICIFPEFRGLDWYLFRLIDGFLQLAMRVARWPIDRPLQLGVYTRFSQPVGIGWLSDQLSTCR